MRGVTRLLRSWNRVFRFQPALPMRGVTVLDVQKLVSGLISTRTPHAGSDGIRSKFRVHRAISTRTPHAGSD